MRNMCSDTETFCLSWKYNSALDNWDTAIVSDMKNVNVIKIMKFISNFAGVYGQTIFPCHIHVLPWRKNYLALYNKRLIMCKNNLQNSNLILVNQK